MKKAISILGILLLLSLCANIRLYQKLPKCPSPVTENPAPISAPALPQSVVTEQPKAHETPAPLPRVTIDDCYLSDGQDKDGRFYPKEITCRIDNLGKTPSLSELVISPTPKRIEKTESDGSFLRIYGEFDYETDYAVTFPAGLNIAGTTKNTPPASIAVKGIKPPTNLLCDTRALYYPVQTEQMTGARPLYFSINSVNVKNCIVELFRQEDQNLNFPNRYRNYKDYMTSVAQKEYKLNCRSNFYTATQLDLAPLLKGQKPGLFLLRLKKNDKQYSSDECAIVFSDLGASITLFDKTAAVSVRSLLHNTSVAAAKVELYSKGMQRLATSITKEDGTALLHFEDKKMDRRQETPGLLLVKTATDITFLELNYKNVISEPADYPNALLFQSQPNCQIIPERGIYRPGETAQLTLLLREAKGSLSIPLAQAITTISLQDAAGNLFHQQNAKTDANGVARILVQLPKTIPSGQCTAKCLLGNELLPDSIVNFQIGTFTPDRIKFALQSTKDLLKNGEKPQFKYSAEFYYGAPVNYACLKAILTAKCAPFPRHWAGYTVGSPKANATFLSEKNTQISIKSRSISFPTPGKDLDGFGIPCTLTADVTLTEEASRPISATATTTYLPTEAFVGIRELQSSGLDKSLDIRLLTWRPNQATADSKSTTITLEKLEWRYLSTFERIREKFKWEQVVTNTRTLPAIPLTANGHNLKISNLPNGKYRITIADARRPKAETTLEFWHWYGDGDSVRCSDPTSLTIKTNKNLYLPNEIAQITMEADGDGLATVAIGAKEISALFATPVKAGANQIAVQIPPEITTDSCFLTITLTSQQNGDIVRKSSIFRLNVDNKRYKLPLKLTTIKKTEPKKALPITVEGPAGSTVVLWAVDEGILSLTNYKTPDPLLFFHGTRFSPMKEYDLYGRVFPSQARKPLDKTGGDGVALAARLPVMKPLNNAICLLPPMLIPANGKLICSITPEKFNGSLRIIAIGSSGTQVGSTDTAVIVREKAVIQTLAPAAVAPKDSFSIQLRIDASQFTDKIQPTICKICPDAPELAQRKLAPGEFILGYSLPKELSTHQPAAAQAKAEKGIFLLTIPVLADKEGHAVLPYTLYGAGGYTQKGKVELDVRSIYPAITHVESIMLKPGETWTAETLAGTPLQDGVLSLAGTPQVSLIDCIKWLENYPYACLEQTVSSALPLLALKEAQSKASAYEQSFDGGRVDEIAIRLCRMMQGAKGFEEWPGMRKIWHEASLYAAHFLLLSNSVYFTDAHRANVVSYLKSQTRASHNNDAYVVYLKALAKMDEAAKEAEEILENQSYTGFQHFLAAAALVRTGHASAASTTIQKSLQNQVWEDDQQDELPWIFQSAPARRGVFLAIASQIAPDSEKIHKLAQELLKYQGSDESIWGCTRDNAWCALGLLRYHQRYPQKTGTAILTRNGVEQKYLVIKPLRFTFGTKENFSLRNAGDTPLFLTRTTLLAPNAQPQPKGCVKVEKRIVNGKGEIVTKWKKGDLLTIQLLFQSSELLPHAVIEDRLAGCFEIENGTLATRQSTQKRTPKGYATVNELIASNQYDRPDRYLFFTRLYPDGKHWLSYNVRVIADGKFAIPPAHIEDMYQPSLQGTSPPHTSEQPSIQVENK